MANSQDEQKTEYEMALIKTLRQDAKDVKDCFTKYSFQAIAFSSSILGIIARYQSEYPQIALASIASIIILVVVARIGIYKYGSANRMYGYELHLFRTRKLPESKGNGWKHEYRQIGWEEAMRAWRIVQVSVFGKLYVTKKFFQKRLKKEHQNKFEAEIKAEKEMEDKIEEKYKWFDIKELAEPEAEYHPGSYLSTINNILFGLAALSTVSLFIMAIQIDGQILYGFWHLVTYFIVGAILHYENTIIFPKYPIDITKQYS